MLLFVFRFLLRGHLVPQSDQECHIGGIALDVLTHGVRFPLLAYAPNEYDNGSFFSGLLTSVSFSLLGRNVLALKLVTHFVSALGAVATLALLRDCLDELGLRTRLVRFVATTVLLIELALATRVVTVVSTYAVGNHAEGASIIMILLALFSRAFHSRARSLMRTATRWALVGLALYVNKATLLVLPVLGAAEIALAWRNRRQIAAAASGLLAGMLPELVVVVQRRAMGWTVMAGKAERGQHGFPDAFVDSVLTLAEHRPELLAAWALAVVAGIALFVHRLLGRDRSEPATTERTSGGRPIALVMVLGVACSHLLVLTVLAQGGIDAYATYSFPALAVLLALTFASITAHTAARWREGAAAWSAVGAIALTAVLYRPHALVPDTTAVSALWQNRAGAACSWRFAEGFEREHQYGLAAAAETREQHAIKRCRSLSETDQILDCIGGIARELHWRRGGAVPGAPPSGLTDDERRAYAYLYGTHRKGDSVPCREFVDPDLAELCTAAAELECLTLADTLTRFASGRRIARPHCPIREPPMDGYWAAMRSELLQRPEGSPPDGLTAGGPDTDLGGCGRVLRACFGAATATPDGGA